MSKKIKILSPQKILENFGKLFVKSVNGVTPDANGNVVVQGGGGGSLATLTDVDIDSPANNEVLAYNEVTGKWENKVGGGGGGVELGETSTTAYRGDRGKQAYDHSQTTGNPHNTPIPSKTSDLSNDSNFIVDANYVHTDNNYSDADAAIVAATSGTNTGDQDLSGLQPKTDNTLTTTDKTIVGAINEVNSKANDSENTKFLLANFLTR